MPGLIFGNIPVMARRAVSIGLEPGQSDGGRNPDLPGYFSAPRRAGTILGGLDANLPALPALSA
jgi:hypothetical protein